MLSKSLISSGQDGGFASSIKAEHHHLRDTQR
jgi:hypothetical protein